MYALSWCSKLIQQHFENHVQKGETNLWSIWITFLEHMQMKFGLQDPSRIAIKAIETIQMPKTQTIIYYDLKFEKYANQIQDSYYSEKAYICYYYEGLTD